MSHNYDVIVVGVGSMGAATCFHLAKRGVRVLGLEQFSIPNDRGAHHGDSRVIRLAYFEHPDYVPLLVRSYENWREIESLAGQQLLHIIGGLYMGRPGSQTIAGSLQSMAKHNLPNKQITREQLRLMHPMFNVPEDYVALIDPDMGFVLSQDSVSAFADQAIRQGASLHGHEPVRDWSADGTGVRVVTDKATYTAGRIILCGGAWSSRLVSDLGMSLKVTRQVLGWVTPREPENFTYGQLPVWVIEDGPDGVGGLHYGFPMMSGKPGFKIALHRVEQEIDPDKVNREVEPEDERTFRTVLQQWIPSGDGPLLAIQTCLYTNSPDGHFIVDQHPTKPNAIVACGFSGHGFKFAAVMGEALADLATNGKTDLPIEFLGLSRFK